MGPRLPGPPPYCLEAGWGCSLGELEPPGLGRASGLIAGVLAPTLLRMELPQGRDSETRGGLGFLRAHRGWGNRSPTAHALPSHSPTHLCVSRVSGYPCPSICAALTAGLPVCAVPMCLASGSACRSLSPQVPSLQVPLHTRMDISISAPLSLSRVPLAAWPCMFLGVCVQRQGEVRLNTQAQGRRSGVQMVPPRGACGCVCRCVPARARRRHEAG